MKRHSARTPKDIWAKRKSTAYLLALRDQFAKDNAKRVLLGQPLLYSLSKTKTDAALAELELRDPDGQTKSASYTVGRKTIGRRAYSPDQKAS